MPIRCSQSIRPVSDAAFAELDRVVMGCAYASQNTLGRLCDKRVYENDLAARLRAEGVNEVQTQVPLTVTHGGFSKMYRLDLVVQQMVYELAVADALTAEHQTQAIHYAALLALDRIKLLNFRSPRVEGKLLRTPFASLDRRHIRYDETRWQPLSDRCADLKQHLRALLADWGSYLELPLYEDALVYFHGGESDCLRRVSIIRDGIELGTHPVACHADKLAFVLTALKDSLTNYEHHLQRLMGFTMLRGIQWINLHHAEVTFVTLQNGRRIGAKE